MKIAPVLFLVLTLAATTAFAEGDENLFLNADFSDGFAHWIGYQGGPDGIKRTEPDTFVKAEDGNVTITPFKPTGHQLNFYQGFGQRGQLNPPLTEGTTYEFEVDFIGSTTGKAKLSVLVYFFDSEYQNIKRATLPLIQTPGKTTGVHFTVPKGVAIVHVGVCSLGPGSWPGKDFEGSYTVGNFRLRKAKEE